MTSNKRLDMVEIICDTIFVVVFLGFFLGLAVTIADAAETHTESEYHEVRNVAGVRQGNRHPTREACIAAALALGVEKGKTATSGQDWFNCYSVKSFKFTYRAGTTTPTALTAPVNFSALPTSPTSITLRWENTPNAAAVDIERCSGANCTNFTRLSCFVGSTRLSGSLTASTSYSYRIRSSRNSTCTSDFSGYAGPVSATTPALPDPEPTTGAAVLSWTPPTQMTDGTPFTTLRNYRILYGTSATNLDRSIETPAGPLSTYTVTGLAPGTYYFAVRAIAGGGAESANSNVVTKTVR